MKRFWQILHVFKQWSIWTPHTPQYCFQLCGSQSLLGNSAWVREKSFNLPLALTTAETITHPFNNLYWEVFLSFQYSCPHGILRAIFVEPKRKKNVLNYLFPKVLALPHCLFLFPPSFSSFRYTGPWLDGVALLKHCNSTGYSTGKFVWSHHIYRLMQWARLALYYLVLWTRQRNRLWISCTFCWTEAVVTDVEQKIFGFTVFIFTALLKWL